MASQGKGFLTHGNSEKALFTEKNRWSDRPRIVYFGRVFGASPSSRIQEEGPTDGNGSWKSSDTTDRHA
jgi:hypothetical protein